MSFRTKLLLACLPLALAPLFFFGWGTRREVSARLDSLYTQRVDALADVIEAELARQSAAVSAGLDRVAENMPGDNALRIALNNDAAGGGSRAALLDYAEEAMPLSGLDVLRIQDPEGRVLSSGHFRNEFDAVDPALWAALARAGDRAVLATFQTPGDSILALARARAVILAGRDLILVGGVAVDSIFVERLALGTGLAIELRLPGSGTPQSDTGPTRTVDLPVSSPSGEVTASFVVHASDAPLVELQRNVDRRLLVSSGVAAVLAVLLALTAAAALSRPVERLAHEAGRVDLDRLDVDFASERLDEVGALSRVLDRMTRRLRASAMRLRDTERRAATGDIARQVNHDVKNGLIPIRNVVSHLTQMARERPDEMPAVFLERQATLESSIRYLQSLATNYARLSPSLEKRACDLNAIARDVVADALAGGAAEARSVKIVTELAESLPRVMADPVALRRILENLLVNAVESLSGVGRVVVSTRLDRTGDRERILMSVADDGRGLTPTERARIFDDFYTTKPGGTGLGLSIVRRLVADLGGRIDVESVTGEGTRFTVELFAADDARSGGSGQRS